VACLDGECEDGNCDDAGACLDGDCEEGTCETGTCDDDLPVELANFDVSLVKEELVNVQWSTFSETNNKGFEILHSMDGMNWDVKTFVEGHGTTTERKSYLWQDKSPQAGINYYRLKQIDIDGKTKLHRIKAVEILSDQLVVQLFPNPTRASTSLYLYSQQDELVTIKVYSAQGKTVIKTKQMINYGDNIVDINLEGFAKGTYSIIIKSKRKVIAKKQLVLN